MLVARDWVMRKRVKRSWSGRRTSGSLGVSTSCLQCISKRIIPSVFSPWNALWYITGKLVSAIMIALLEKNALAWATKDASSNGLKTKNWRPSRSSGASALVKATLNPSAAMPKAKEAADESWRDAHGTALLASLWTTSRYVASTRSQNMKLWAGKSVFAISGSPACFWPVWFQARTTRKSASSVAAKHAARAPPFCTLLRLWPISGSMYGGVGVLLLHK